MSKIISDEKITQILRENPVEELGFHKTHYQVIAEAQRDASDKEWIELLKRSIIRKIINL